MKFQEKILNVRMDKNLYKQLKRYADRNDHSVVSITARNAIKKFLDEIQTENLDKKT